MDAMLHLTVPVPAYSDLEVVERLYPSANDVGCITTELNSMGRQGDLTAAWKKL